MSEPRNGNGKVLLERIGLLERQIESTSKSLETLVALHRKNAIELVEVLVLMNALIADTRRHLGLSETETELASGYLADIKASLENLPDGSEQ